MTVPFSRIVDRFLLIFDFWFLRIFQIYLLCDTKFFHMLLHRKGCRPNSLKWITYYKAEKILIAKQITTELLYQSCKKNFKLSFLTPNETLQGRNVEKTSNA